MGMRRVGGLGVLLFYGFAPIEPRWLQKDGVYSHGTVIRPSLVRAESGEFDGAPYVLYRDANSGAVREIDGQLAVYDGADHEVASFEAFCRAYIVQHPAFFSFGVDDLQVLPSAFLSDSDVTFVKFHLYRDGKRVSDAAVDFRFKQDTLVQVIDASFSEAHFHSKASLREPQDLVAHVENQFPKSHLSEGEALWRIQETGRGYELVPVIRYFVHSPTEGNVVMDVGQQTGRTYEWRDADAYFEGKAQADIYPRYYLDKLATVGLPFIKLQTGGTKVVETSIEGVFSSEERELPVLSGFGGAFVTNRLLSGTAVRQQATQGADGWKIFVEGKPSKEPWKDKNLAQPMVYYHVNALVKEAKRFISLPWLNAPLTANVNLNRTCNAHWDGSTINLYSGDSQCANTGLISDVMYHEWGHGLHDKSSGIDDYALSEGYGDILSLLMTRSPLLGVGFFAKTGKPVRDLQPTKKYPDDQGEVHSEGLIIGSTFWDLFLDFSKKYGEEKAVEMLKMYAFKMIFTVRTYLDVYPTLLVLNDDDKNPANGTPDLCLMNRVFVKHGLTKEDPICTVPTTPAPTPIPSES